MDNTITKQKLDSTAKSIGQKVSSATEKPALFKTDAMGNRVWVGGHIRAGQLQPNIPTPPLPNQPLAGAKDTVKNITTKAAGVVPPTPPVPPEPSTSSVTGSLSKEQLQAQAQEVAQARAQWQADVKTLESTLTGEPSRTEELETLQTKYGVQKYAKQLETLRPQIAQLQGEINALTVEENNKASLLDERLASRAAIDQATNVMAREYDRKRAALSAQLAAKSAMMEAYNGNLTSARALVNDALDAWTYDQQIKMQDLKTLMTVHRDWYNSLDTDYQRELSNSRKQWEKEAEQARADARSKMTMMIDAAAKGIDLGWDPGKLGEMTVEEATKQYVAKVAPEMAKEDITDVEQLQKEYNEAIATGAISPDTTFQQFYAKMTRFGTEPLSKVAELSQVYAEMKAKGAIPKGMTEAEFIAQAMGIDLTSPAGGFPEAQNDWEQGNPVNAAQLKLIKERVYSQDTVPEELFKVLQGNFDKQFDTPRTNEELVDLIQLKYRLDMHSATPQQTHDWLETAMNYSSIPSEQLTFARKINEELLAQQTAYKKQTSRDWWKRFLRIKPTEEVAPRYAEYQRRLQESRKASKQSSPSIAERFKSVGAGIQRAGESLNNYYRNLYDQLWKTK